MRVLAFRTGSGLSFEVAVERGFDLLAAEYRGIPIGWRSPTGPRHPALASVEDSRGWGFLRSFTGLLATCGLDHALAPAPSSAAGYLYRGIAETDYPFHGRISQIPARLLAMASAGTATPARSMPRARSQMAVFGENLVLTRRIEAALGGMSISVVDRVENRGFRPTPHMLLYHYNFGFPLLDEGAELLLPSRRSSTPCTRTRAPRASATASRGRRSPTFREQVYEHDMVAGADGMVPDRADQPEARPGRLRHPARLRSRRACPA